MNTTIMGESVQEVYNWYKKNSLIVNRKYQRKLVWTMEEKSKLIDTIKQEFPIPLILLAETDDKKEIIDGMQRLNAIFDFIENKVSLNGKFFDLDSLASTKQYKDNGSLIQKNPILDRDTSVNIANYKLAVSIYKEGEDIETINEIFRRINSSGRKLSRQEIRQVGLIGGFAELVSDLASKIRGDVSRDNIIELNNMSKISISMEDDHNGIKANDIYWCKKNILTKHDIRESEDEALIANILILIFTNKGYRVSNEELDFAYGKSLDNDDKKATKRVTEIEQKLNQYISSSQTGLQKEFIKIFDELKTLNITFSSKRKYIVLFLAFHELIFRSSKQVIEGQRNNLTNTIQTTLESNVNTTQGGTWALANIIQNINIIIGAISMYFEPTQSAIFNQQKITEIENIISTSDTESIYYDFKQGFHRLDTNNTFDDGAFKKILETICAIANNSKNNTGYIIIGVADTEQDKTRIEQIYNEQDKSRQFANYYITGTNGESTKYTSKDSYYQFIANKIESEKRNFKNLRNCTIEPVNYYDRYLFLIKIESGGQICQYGNDVFYRVGAQTMKADIPKVIEITQRFS